MSQVKTMKDIKGAVTETNFLSLETIVIVGILLIVAAILLMIYIK